MTPKSLFQLQVNSQCAPDLGFRTSNTAKFAFVQINCSISLYIMNIIGKNFYQKIKIGLIKFNSITKRNSKSS